MPLKRKILFLPRWYPTEEDPQNGVFIQKHARAAALRNTVVVLYVTSTLNHPRILKTSSGNLTEMVVFYKKRSSRFYNMLAYILALFQSWRRLSSSRFEPEICHLHMLFRPALLAVWLKWRHDIPYIISEHWSRYLTGQVEKLPRVKKSFARHIFRNAALTTVVSPVLKEALQRCGLTADARIVPNVVETAPEAWKQQPADDTFRYLVVADLKDEIKNISGVIRAFASVHAKEPRTQLMIVGDGSDRRSLEKLAAEFLKGIPSFPVKFMGEKTNEEVLKIIPTAHAIIVNSRVETFSVVTLEAIFSGRPVIATRCGGPEAFINEQNGFLIDKDNDKQLEDAMLYLKNNYTQYPAEKVRSSIPNNYSMESIADMMDECYDAAYEGV